MIKLGSLSRPRGLCRITGIMSTRMKKENLIFGLVDEVVLPNRNYGFRLIGLVAQGSIPWACVGLVALFTIAVTRFVGLNLSVHSDLTKEVKLMRKKTHLFRVFGSSLLDTIWAIETKYAAGALPA